MTQEQETDIQSALSDFYVKFPLVKGINVMDDMIVYSINPFDHGYAKHEADRVIKENNLNLKATLSGVGLFKNNRLTIEPK